MCICGLPRPGCADRGRPRCCTVFMASVERKGGGRGIEEKRKRERENDRQRGRESRDR